MSSNSAPATAVGIAAGAALEPAASTSRRMMRPPGPEPWTSRRSTPVCAAIFLASGDAFTRPPCPCTTPATAAAGALVTAAGRMTEAGGADGVTVAGRDAGATADAAPAPAGVGARRAGQYSARPAESPDGPPGGAGYPAGP